jgi:hypothetical protein
MATSNNSPDVAEDRGRLELVGFGEELPSGRFAPSAVSQAKLDEVAGLIAPGGEFAAVMGIATEVVTATFRAANIRRTSW